MSGPKVHEKLSVTNVCPAVILQPLDPNLEKRLLQRAGLFRCKNEKLFDSRGCANSKAEDSPATSTSRPTVGTAALEESGAVSSKRSYAKNDASNCQLRNKKFKKRKAPYEFYPLPLKKIRNQETKDLIIALFGPDNAIVTREIVISKSSSLNPGCPNTDASSTCCANSPTASNLSSTSPACSHKECEYDLGKESRHSARPRVPNEAASDNATSLLLNDNDTKKSATESSSKFSEEIQICPESRKFSFTDGQNEANFLAGSEDTNISEESSPISSADEQNEDNLSAGSAIQTSSLIENSDNIVKNGVPSETSDCQKIKQTTPNSSEKNNLSENPLLDCVEDYSIVQFHDEYFRSWVNEVKSSYKTFIDDILSNFRVIQNVRTSLQAGDTSANAMWRQITNHSSICEHLAQIFSSVINHKNFQLFVLCYMLRIYQLIFQKSVEKREFFTNHMKTLKNCLYMSLRNFQFHTASTKLFAQVLNNQSFEESCDRIWHVIRESSCKKVSDSQIEKQSNRSAGCVNTSTTDQIITSPGAQMLSDSIELTENNNLATYTRQSNSTVSRIVESGVVDSNRRTSSKVSCLQSKENSPDNISNEPAVAKPSVPVCNAVASAGNTENEKSLAETFLGQNKQEWLSSNSSNYSFGTFLKELLQSAESTSPVESNLAEKGKPASNKCITMHTPLIDSQKENVPCITGDSSETQSANRNVSISQAQWPSKQLSSTNQCTSNQQLNMLPLHESANSNLQPRNDHYQNVTGPSWPTVDAVSRSKVARTGADSQTIPQPPARRRNKQFQAVSDAGESFIDQSNIIRSSVTRQNRRNQSAPFFNNRMAYQTPVTNQVRFDTHTYNNQFQFQNPTVTAIQSNIDPSHLAQPILQNQLSSNFPQSRVVRDSALRQLFESQTTVSRPHISQESHQLQQNHPPPLNQQRQLQYQLQNQHVVLHPPAYSMLDSSLTSTPPNAFQSAITVPTPWFPVADSQPVGLLRRTSLDVSHNLHYVSTVHGNDVTHLGGTINCSRKTTTAQKNPSSVCPLRPKAPRTIQARRRSEMDVVQQPLLHTGSICVSSSTTSSSLPQQCLTTSQTNSNVILAHPQFRSVPALSSALNQSPLNTLQPHQVPSVQNTSVMSMEKVRSCNVTGTSDVSVPNIRINQFISAKNNEGASFVFHIQTVNSEVCATGQERLTSSGDSSNERTVSSAQTAINQPVELPDRSTKTPDETMTSNHPSSAGFNATKKKPRVKYTERRPVDHRRRNLSLGKFAMTRQPKSIPSDDLSTQTSPDDPDKESDCSSSDLQIDLDFVEQENDTVQSSLEEPQGRLNDKPNTSDHSDTPGAVNETDVLKILEGIDPASFSKDYVLNLVKEKCSSDKSNVERNASSTVVQCSGQGSSNSSENGLSPHVYFGQTETTSTPANHSDAASPVTASKISRPQGVTVKSKQPCDEAVSETDGTETAMKHNLPAFISKPSRSLRKSQVSRKKSLPNPSSETTSQNCGNANRTVPDQQYEVLNDPENIFKIVLAAKNVGAVAASSDSQQNVIFNGIPESVAETSTGTSAKCKTTQKKSFWDSLDSQLKATPLEKIQTALIDIYFDWNGGGESDRLQSRSCGKKSFMRKVRDYFDNHPNKEKLCEILNSHLATAGGRQEEEGERINCQKEMDAAKEALIQGQILRNEVSASTSQLTPPPTPIDECSWKACSKVISGSNYSCDGCRKVVYCSESCKNEDFFANHCNECERDDIF